MHLSWPSDQAGNVEFPTHHVVRAPHVHVVVVDREVHAVLRRGAAGRVLLRVGAVVDEIPTDARPVIRAFRLTALARLAATQQTE